MESESTAKAVLTVKRSAARNKHSFEDLLYVLMGDATPGNVIMLIFGIAFFAATPIAMLLLFGAYSGGMRWVITLGTMAAMGVVAILLMGRGVSKRRKPAKRDEVKTEFPGGLTNLTETMERAASGYIYSQQMIRERLCEIMVNKLGVARDLGPDEMIAMLESKDASFVGDEVLAKFLLKNRRGVKGWEDARVEAKGKSAERGRKFMSEIDDILERMEAIV
jgi:membrane protein implicated in regulation of membrane protease activity